MSKRYRPHPKQAAAQQLNWAIYSSMGAAAAMHTVSTQLLTFIHNPEREKLQRAIRKAIHALADVEALARQQTSNLK